MNARLRNTPNLVPARDEPGRTFSAPPRGPGAMLALGLAGVLLLTAACWPMQHHVLPEWAAAALAAGLAAWLVVAWKAAAPRDELPGIRVARLSLDRLAAGLLVSLGLAAFSWTRTAAGRFDLPGTAAWLVAMVLWFWAWSQQQTPEAAAPEPAAPRPRKFATALAFLAILAIGAFFRFHRLSEIPPHPGSDHAEDLLNIEDLARGERPVFFPRNTGRPRCPSTTSTSSTGSGSRSTT